jgi:signal transduction histidine kinase
VHLVSPRASLEIEDKGCGFNIENLEKFGGFGLTGMAGRANEIGWDLEIKSRPGEGTHIRVEERQA